MMRYRTKPPAIKDRALRHMNEALAFGWKAQSQIEDYAIAALDAEGYDPDRAADAVRAAWDDHFKVWGAG